MHSSEFGQIIYFIHMPSYGSYCLLSQLIPVSTPSLIFDLTEVAVDYSARIFAAVVCTNVVRLVGKVCVNFARARLSWSM